ncbi:leucine/isoleucine/valine transporter permease subunit [Hartmannibacter diazotrophicus]|uniref:Leucine/isoleucine/valine transporter permease subunit n=1 Tax=Hartmannibacter diazotrophicus TaxID=1482074 RepID=A0A2C9D8R2_9HYPH|nr:branched-chain amino acid ABC transporter permease [Hartmannibacter diazotrophicus]SON56623.1 leucine/isoleucine/valine transporter permease subunit [Hartmannibacter diazotrophicus]
MTPDYKTAFRRSVQLQWASFLVMLAAGLAVMFGAPLFTDTFGLVQLTGFAAMAIYALSQGFVWGYAGILSFGQATFLGLGGYAYAVSVINMGDSTLPVLISIAVPMLFALLLGYFMFYGRISDAYIGVITLTVSVILFQLVNATSGSQYRIGEAELGGFNGIPAIPPINMPGDPDYILDLDQMWYAGMGALILAYVFLRAVLASRFGRVVVAIRENETRAQLLGYDPRLYKLLAFVVSAGVAGLGGCVFANWGGFISPTVFSLTMSAEVIVFVLVGGLGTLLGPILGGVFISWLIIKAGTQSAIDSNLGLGIVLVLFVLLIPQGIVPSVRALLRGVLYRLLPKPASEATIAMTENLATEGKS